MRFAIVDDVRISLGRRDLVAMAVLSLMGVGIPLWLAAAAGAIGIPTVDDWVYMRGASSVFNSGTIDMPGHTAASIGQLLMVQPLLIVSGGDPWAFTAFGLIMTLIGILATYVLARRFVGTGSAVMVVLVVEAFPGFARVSASFMTDVPAYALGVLCLLLGTVWLESGRRWALLACLSLGILAVSVREFAVAASGAVLLISWARSAAKDRAWLAGISVGFALGVAGVLFAASLVPGRAVPQTSGGLGRIVLIVPAMVTLAAVLLPTLALAIGRQMQTLMPAQILAAVGVACLAFVAPWGAWTGGGGNFWTPFGLAGDGLLRGTRETVIDAPTWALSDQVASTAVILLATLVISWAQRDIAGVRSIAAARATLGRVARSQSGLLGTFVLIGASGLIAFSAVYGVWDRYLYPLVPASAILILRWRPERFRFSRSMAFSHAAFAWLALSAFVIAANSFAYDAARWREGEAAVAMGYDPRTIDAGYEWVGFHAAGTGGQGGGDRGQAWFENLMFPAPLCAIVSNSPPGSDEPLLDDSLVPLDGNYILLRADRSAYSQYLFLGFAQSLYVYRSPGAGCPKPSIARTPTGRP
jgi:4-amino-4-deoxy-L-arabinose transferase-like glycosyltransferase